MSSVRLSGNAGGTGIFTIASPNSNSSPTMTLPDNTGTIITTASTFAGTGPAFSAYQSSAQTLSSTCLLYTSPSPRDYAASRMPSSA